MGKITLKEILAVGGIVLGGIVAPKVADAAKLSISTNGTYENVEKAEVSSVWYDFSNKIGRVRLYNNIETSKDKKAPTDRAGLDINLPKNSGAFAWTKGLTREGENLEDIGVWTEQEAGKVKVFGDAEAVLENKEKPLYFAMLGLKTKNIAKGIGASGDIAATQQRGKETDRDKEERVNGWVSVYNNHLYGAVGKGDHVRHAYLGVHGFKNTGLFARAMKDKTTGKWYVKMQGAEDKANQDFFNVGNFDDNCVRYFVLGSFFEKHSSSFMGKGNVAGKLEIVSDKDEQNVQYTAEIGKQINSIIQVGTGVDIIKSKEKDTKAGLAYELRASSPLGKGYNATAEINGNTRTGDGGFWLNFSKTF